MFGPLVVAARLSLKGELAKEGKNVPLGAVSA
jgi:hypothetical protein